MGTVVLTPGTRLEPTASLPDVGLLETSPLPLCVTFWKPNKVDSHQVTDMMHHQCPLFAPMPAISPQASLAVDTLHTLFFGPVMRLVSAIAWRVLAMNPWEFRGAKAVVLEQGCRQLGAHVLQCFVDENIPNNLRTVF